jgi:hypothetical protein
MPPSQGPLLPRRRLGAELRRLRGDRTLDEVAAETLISTSKLSRLENGQGVPQLRDIRDLINCYDADRATSERLRRWMNEGRRQAWWKEYSDVIRESYDVLLDYESGASVTRMYTPTTLPGLLQTRAYATQLLSTLYPHLSADEVSKLVEVRLRRQQTVLNDADDTSQLQAIIDEAAVLRARAMSPDDEARAQLLHLRDVSKRRNVSIRVLPLSSGLHAGLMGRFAVYQFSDDIDRDVVHIETHSGDRYLEEQSSVLEYLRLFDSVAHRALDHPETRDLLTQLVEAPQRTEENT